MVPSKFAAWMLRAEKPLKAPTATAEIEPKGFSIWFETEYPNMTQPEWGQAPGWMKDEFLNSKKRSRGRNVGTANEVGAEKYNRG